MSVRKLIVPVSKLYTDTIVFAPLASTFHIHRLQAEESETSTPAYAKLRGHLGSSLSLSTPAATASEGQTYPLTAPKASLSMDASSSAIRFPSRKAWIAEWERNNPGRPRPCSAKAVYRLADSMADSSSYWCATLIHRRA